MKRVTRVERPCAHCGAAVLLYPKEAEQFARSFCNRGCYRLWLSGEMTRRIGAAHPNWLGGGPAYRGPNWRSQRGRALDRDDHRCVDCGTSARTVHHKIPFRLFASYIDANDLANLETLCPEHHAVKERLFWAQCAETASAIPIATTVACKKCGLPFTPDRVLSPKRYCAGCRVTKPCEVCGTVIDVTSRCRAVERVRFCSKRCAGKVNVTKRRARPALAVAEVAA